MSTIFTFVADIAFPIFLLFAPALPEIAPAVFERYWVAQTVIPVWLASIHQIVIVGFFPIARSQAVTASWAIPKKSILYEKSASVLESTSFKKVVEAL